MTSKIVITQTLDLTDMEDALLPLNIVKPTVRQLQVIWDTLPVSIQKSAIHWGLTDTNVRDEIFLFLQTNPPKVMPDLSEEELNQMALDAGAVDADMMECAKRAALAGFDRGIKLSGGN